MQRLLLALAGLVLVSHFAIPTAGAASAVRTNDPAAIESEFVARINQLRASRGLGSLSVDGELTAASRSWAGSMVNAGGISHAPDLSVGVSADWAKIGENVGEGNEIGPLFDAFVASPTHLKNLVDPVFTHVGVGVIVNAEGRIFTTHRFMSLRPTPTPAPPPAPVEAQPVAASAPPPTVAAPRSTTTAPPTTAAPTTTTQAPEPVGKLGPLEVLPSLIAL